MGRPLTGGLSALWVVCRQSAFQMQIEGTGHSAERTCTAKWCESVEYALDPAKYIRLADGDAHVIRNAGGRASDDAIRFLVIPYKLLGMRE
jgi:hypothetical protein